MKISLNFSCPDLEIISSIFQSNNYSFRVIGGAVRDALISNEIKDIDIATDALPEDVSRIFVEKGLKVIPTGINYGTVTVVIKEKNFEITTLREDIKTDGRYAQVSYTKDYFMDAKRRDFTINSLSYDVLSEELYDYFDGLNDLKNGVVRFIGDSEQRILEDHLRILRFYRFSAYYANSIETTDRSSCKKLSSSIRKLSKERIEGELSRIFSCPRDISLVVKSLEEDLILKNIFDEANIDITGIVNFEKKFWEKNDSYIPDLYISQLKLLRITFLLFTLGRKIINHYLKDLRFSNKDIDEILNLYDFINKIIDLENKSDIYFEVCKAWYYKGHIITQFLLICYIFDKIDPDELLNGIAAMSADAPKMPVNGHEIEESGFFGLQLRMRKNFLEEQWIKSGFSISKEELLNLKDEKNANQSKN